MDDRLRLIQYLYDEEVDDPAFARRLTEDEALYREYEQLRATKEKLDRRSSPQPDSAVVDAVVDEARAASRVSSAPSAGDADRPARAPARSWSRRLQAASVGVALALLAGLGWWQGTDPVGEPTAGAGPEMAQQTAPTAAEARGGGAQAVPAWDDSDELVRIHRRIEQLQANSGSDAWGTLQSVDRTRP